MKRYVITGLAIALFLVLGSHAVRVAASGQIYHATILSQVQPECKGDRTDDCDRGKQPNPPKPENGKWQGS